MGERRDEFTARADRGPVGEAARRDEPWRRSRGLSRRRLLGLPVLVGVAGLAYVTRDRWWPDGVDLPVPGLHSVSWDARPDFTLPFACGERWRLTTYAGHNPEDKKLDMYRVDGETRGSVVRASAPGRVKELVHPGGVKIDHGEGWYTLSLHMQEIAVEPGDEVRRGDPIGLVGSVATSVAHLHYEQLFDDDAKGNARPFDMVHPILEGVEYRLSPDDEFPVVESTTNC